MDANGSRFHLVLTHAEWCGAACPTGLEWSRATRTLSLAPQSFLVQTAGATAPPTIADRRGAARDQYGNWYWIGRDRDEIRFRGGRAPASERFWPRAEAEPPFGDPDGFTPLAPASPAPRMLAGLAVTTDHYLIAGVPGISHAAAGLLIFDLHGAGAPYELQWPAAVSFEPFDIAPGQDGGVWILDRVNRLIWRLDRHFRACAEQLTSPPRPVVLDFGDAVPGRPCAPAQRAPSRAITIDRAIPLPFADPVAVEGLPDGSVLVLETRAGSAASIVHRYAHGRRAWSVSLERALAGRLAPSPDRPPRPIDFAIAGHDLAFVSDADAPNGGVKGIVMIVARSGNQAFAFRIDDSSAASLPHGVGVLGLPPEAEFFPLRLFGGKALVSAGGHAHYDIDDRWVPLARQPRPRFALDGVCTLPPAGAHAGAFDSGQPGCVWHRVFVDACVPPDCEIAIESRAADRVDDLASATTEWRPEPRPYRRHTGSEIAYYTPPLPGAADRTGTYEVLLQHAVGRYLQLRIVLRGSGRSTPRLHALRVYYPRFSYLREYLPTVYRDDRESASFLDRYLANAEGFFTDHEGRIEHVAALLDHRLIPADYLEWLSGWLGATLDAAWPDDRRRFFLAHAWRMFRERGTTRGIARAIRLTLDECVDDSLFDDSVPEPPFAVRIAERFLARPAPGVDVTVSEDEHGPALVPRDAPWTPRRGAGPLHERFQAFLRTQYASIDDLSAAWDETFAGFADVRFTVAPTGQRRRAADWRAFVSTALGFTYIAPIAADTRWFRDFLAIRYRHISEWHGAYDLDPATAPATFEDIDLPAHVPDAGAALADWIAFVSVFLPMRRAAHRFSVLIPARPGDSHALRQQKMEIARRIAAREKPAHTEFDVGLYWALFRVGEGRLGADTVLGESSRVVAIELGATAMGDGFLAPPHPWDVNDRAIVGRERFGGDDTGTTPAVLEH